MGRLSLLGISLLLLASRGGARLNQDQEGQSPVQGKSDNIRFYGDKTLVKVKATPEEVDKYLLDGKHLILWSVLSNPRIVGNDRLEKLGDQIRVEGRMFGIPIWFEMTLVNHQPGEEIWYVYKLSTGGMGFLRFRLEPIGDGTRIIKNAGNQMPSAALGDMMEALKFQDRALKSSEKTVAHMQVYFDPSLTPERLSSEGVRGEVRAMTCFFQDYQARIWINASPEKTAESLAHPRNWKILKDQTNPDWDCLSSEKNGFCPVKLNLFGMEYSLGLFPGFSQVGRFDSAYLIFKDFISRIQISLKPSRGGTELTLHYLTEVPAPGSPETTNFLANMGQLPGLIEKMLIELKTAVEGAV